MTVDNGKNEATQMKRKEFISVNFECKALPDTEDANFFYFEGYLSTYGNIDRGGDIVMKGAFDESLKELRPELRWQHMSTEVIGIFEEIKSDDKGLWVKGKLPKDDDLVRGRVIPQMKVGSVRSMSIGFYTVEDSWDENIRTIKKATLIEGSLVGVPMNASAVVTDFKSYTIEDVEEIKTKRDFERLLRDSGCFSKKSVTYLASRFVDVQSDSEDESLCGEFKQLEEKLKELQNV
jgi:HK97 family phage prohead protease